MQPDAPTRPRPGRHWRGLGPAGGGRGPPPGLGAPGHPGRTPETSLGYDLVADLAAHTPGVLLLTATPEQLGRAGHFGRLRLLDPERFHDYAAFLAEEHH